MPHINFEFSEVYLSCNRKRICLCSRLSVLISKVHIAKNHNFHISKSSRKSICKTLPDLAKLCQSINCKILRNIANHCETKFAKMCEQACEFVLNHISANLRNPSTSAKAYLRKLAKVYAFHTRKFLKQCAKT